MYLDPEWLSGGGQDTDREFIRAREDTKGGNGIGKRKAQNRGLVGAFVLGLLTSDRGRVAKVLNGKGGG